MPQAAPQFTPAQILDAGRRAEAEGRLDFAVRFYRHLTDHHGGVPESESAHDALMRIHSRRAAEAFPPAVTVANGVPARPPPIPGLADSPQSPLKMPGITVAPVEDKPVPRLVLPELRRAYGVGRTIARLLTWGGGLSSLAGLVILPLALLSPSTLDVVALDRPWLAHPLTGPGAVIGGVLLMLFGQLARAHLEQASATRNLLSIVLAQAEHRAGDGQPHRYD